MRLHLYENLRVNLEDKEARSLSVMRIYPNDGIRLDKC